MTAKNLERQNRWRNKTVAFRMSPEEAEQLDVNVRLSGFSKQDYLIWRVLQREIKVFGNPRVYKALKNTMAEVLEELQRIASGDNIYAINDIMAGKKIGTLFLSREHGKAVEDELSPERPQFRRKSKKARKAENQSGPEIKDF